MLLSLLFELTEQQKCLFLPHGDTDVGKGLIWPPMCWRQHWAAPLMFSPLELEVLRDKADEKSLLVGVFTVRINGGESEKPRG